jgi:hypothetical protein
MLSKGENTLGEMVSNDSVQVVFEVFFCLQVSSTQKYIGIYKNPSFCDPNVIKLRTGKKNSTESHSPKG